MDIKPTRHAMRSEVAKATIDFIGKMTGVKLRFDAFPPEWRTFLRSFTDRLSEISLASRPNDPVAEMVKRYSPATSGTSEAKQAVAAAWISVADRLPKCPRQPGAMGVEVLVYPRAAGGEATAFYGRRVTAEPMFYRYGAVVCNVTHWMPLPAAPDAGPQAPVAEAARVEPVGVAGTMPGTDGFTMACFEASKVPVGTDLYLAAPAQQPVDAARVEPQRAFEPPMRLPGETFSEWAKRAYETAAPAQQAEALTDATCDVLAERRRQVEQEGWTPQHDDEHDDGVMARAAACYALYDLGVPGATMLENGVRLWPWNWSWLKPKGNRENLVRSGALILAEIERLDRAAAKREADPCPQCVPDTVCTTPTCGRLAALQSHPEGDQP